MPEPAQAEFPAAVASVPAARRWVRSRLPSWLSHEDCERIVLLVSETVTNAVRHARSEVGLRLYDRRPTFRVEIDDGAASLPVTRHAGLDEESGRGVMLIEAVADRWGVTGRHSGKTVWFEVRASSPV
jgi:anti-sigma regulatory factor (Ser/Thr protein kinase)